MRSAKIHGNEMLTLTIRNKRRKTEGKKRNKKKDRVRRLLATASVCHSVCVCVPFYRMFACELIRDRLRFVLVIFAHY